MCLVNPWVVLDSKNVPIGIHLCGHESQRGHNHCTLNKNPAIVGTIRLSRLSFLTTSCSKNQSIKSLCSDSSNSHLIPLVYLSPDLCYVDLSELFIGFRNNQFPQEKLGLRFLRLSVRKLTDCPHSTCRCQHASRTENRIRTLC